MVTARGILWECGVRGYFLLKAAFVHLDLPMPVDCSPTFDTVFLTYWKMCKDAWVSGHLGRVVFFRLIAFAGKALCEVAGLQYGKRGKEDNWFRGVTKDENPA